MDIYLYNHKIQSPDKIEKVNPPAANDILISIIRASFLSVHAEQNSKAQYEGQQSLIQVLRAFDENKERYGKYLLDSAELRVNVSKEVAAYQHAIAKQKHFKTLVAIAEELGGTIRTGKQLDEYLPKKFIGHIQAWVNTHGKEESLKLTSALWAYFYEHFITQKQIHFPLCCLSDDVRPNKKTLSMFEQVIQHVKLEFDDDWVRSLFGKEFQSSKAYFIGTTLHQLFDSQCCYGD